MAYQDDLILSMYSRGEPGLAMGNIPPGKGGSPGQPYDAPKEDPKNPYVPAPKRDLAMDDLSEFDLTEKGLYMHYSGDMFMNLDGMLFPMGQGYDEETHGKFLPKGLVQSMQINPDIARDFTYDEDPGGVVTPRYFSPPRFRYMDHIRTPEIRQQELFNFNNFIESMGGGLDRVQKPNAMMIAQRGADGAHTNVRIYEEKDGYGNTNLKVLPYFGATYNGPIKPKKL